MTGKRIVWRDRSQKRVRQRRRQQGCKFVVPGLEQSDAPPANSPLTERLAEGLRPALSLVARVDEGGGGESRTIKETGD